jgi:Domain of unknown function (DUF4082)/Cadherin-like domain/Bacterial Ig domain
MLQKKQSILSVNADGSPFLFPEADYTLNDITLTDTSLPSAGNTTPVAAAVEPSEMLPPDSISPTNVAAGITLRPSHQNHIGIGSGSPPDFGSVKLAAPPSTGLTATESFDVANNAVLEIKGPVNGSLSGTTITFDTGSGELILDRSAQFHGLIGNSQGTTLSPNDLIDLKDLPFTASMSASVHYDSGANISTVDFSNGSKIVTLQFSGQDLNWIFKSDGQGGTIATDPPTTNPIVLENQKPGTSQDVWWVAPGQDSTKLQGFTTGISTNIGGTVQFKIDNLTGNSNYQIQIYRLGYYGGDGARLISTLQHTTSVVQPAPITNAATGEVDAGNWSVTDSWAIPTTAVSGVYIANVVQGNQVFQIPFVVKDPNSTSDIVFQTADETWQAYNPWGGANLYGGNGPSTGTPGAAYAVSYNRPIITQDANVSAGLSASSNDSLFGAEYAAIYWLEENGYNVSYISGMDTATNGALLLNHKVFMDAGHDEYWTDSQVANVQAAANAGVNLTFLSGNEVFWQTQFTPSIDGSNTANRTLVSYKDSHVEQLINPSGQGTGTFEAPTAWGGAAFDSNALTGTIFSVDDTTLDAITIPYGETNLRIWRNSPVAATAPGKTASLEWGLLGYEWDSSPDNGFMPAGLIDLSSTTLAEPTLNTEFGSVDISGTATHNLVEYRDPTSGALVFGAGTVFWSFGLSDQHDNSPNGVVTTTDPSVQQAMVNLFADMGVQPQTLQASLVIASASTDHTPPTSRITSVSSTSVVEGQSITVNGTATDAGGGVVGAVQISLDGGKTWHVTSGQIGTQTVTWSYTGKAPAPGTFSIETRAVDDSLNLETPGPGVSYTVTPSTALSIFRPGDTPVTPSVGPDNAVEVGFKFTSTNNGQVTGIRFYKGAQNTGTHIVDLWDSTGKLLATATSTNETASGWQQVNFSSPVDIKAGQTYTASYHMIAGQFSDTPYYFDTLQNPTNGALSALASGLNGVFGYSSTSVFPTSVSDTGDNYWVDVVFNDTGLSGPQVDNVSGLLTTENTAFSISASTLLAGDTDPQGLPLSIASVSNPSNGTVTYNASTQTVTFTPNAGYTGPASFTYNVTDGKLTGSGNVSLTVTFPTTAQSLFYTGDTPAITTVNDANSVELGVKIQASSTGVITAIRFYKDAQNIGTHVADLWSSTGTLLATATFSNETASGWQQVNLSQPVLISAGTTYVVSYHTSGNYSATTNYFTTAHTAGALTAQANGTSGGDGVYAYGTGSIFPTNSASGANYFVDVVFDGGPFQPPVANNVTGFDAVKNTALSIPASAILASDTDPNGLPLSITGVSNASNGAVTYNASTQTITFTPNSNYLGPASFTYTITDGIGGTASANVAVAVTPPPPVANNVTGLAAAENTVLSIPASELLANDTDPNGLALSLSGVSNPSNGTVTYDPNTQTVSFTPSSNYLGPASFTYTITDGQASASANVALSVTYSLTAQSLFKPSDQPAAEANDPNSVELGVKFQASANGTITGLRFYKSALDTGTHVAHLWSANGTLLATGTFTNETATGWQQVNFSQPVLITAGTTYVASYHTSGNYSDTSGYFTTAHTSGELTALANGGVYAYGTGAVFPTSSFNAGNYWVDVVFDGASLQPPVANTVSFNAIENTALSIPASAILANDTDPYGLPLSITAVNNPSNGTVTYNASTQTITFVPNSNYLGSASFTYTITDGMGDTASANVAIAVTLPPPVANNVTGLAAAENTLLSIPASVLLANDTDPNGLAISFSGVSNPSNGTVTYDPSTQTINFTPSSNYLGPASFTYTITDGQGSASANAALSVNYPITAQSLFKPSDQPAAEAGDPNSVELGVEFQASATGSITGLRFYKSALDTGTHVAHLWSANGTLLATGTFTNETASGWQQVNFSQPVLITAGTTYVASYHTSGNYSDTSGYFTTPHTFGELTALANGGVYAYGTGSIFPTNSFNASNYWVDVVFNGSSSQAPIANNVSGLVDTTNTTLSIPVSTLLANDSDPGGRPLSFSGVSNPNNGTVSYNATTQTVSFVPTGNYVGPAGFTYTITDGNASASGNVALTVGDASLFGQAYTPTMVSVSDPNSIELGVKFQASENGSITGIEFYKGPQNTGTHVADLWSATGTLLATATFTNETTSGWQEVNFSNPVSVTAGTTYVASYHSNGNYSATPNFFATALTNGPLTAPASSTSGGNGVYAYGSTSLFPTGSFNATNYGVDVLFRPQLVA